MTAYTEDILDKLAERLDTAAYDRIAIPPLVNDFPALTRQDAAHVQTRLIERRLLRGHCRVGLKMGLTSRVKMQQVGVNEAIWGILTSDMAMAEGAQVRRDQFVHPRVEPEIAFLLKRDLHGDESMTEIALAVEAAMPAMEIIDSRFIDFRFGPIDVVADNTSAAGFVVGEPFASGTDLSNMGIMLKVDGRIAQTGSSAAILGHPLRSLAAAARLSAAAGVPAKAGEIILAGAATAAVPCSQGSVFSMSSPQRSVTIEFI